MYREKGLAQKCIQKNVWLRIVYRKRFGLKIYTGKCLAQKFIQERVWLKNLYWKRFGSKIPPYCRGFDITLRQTTLGRTPLGE